MLFSTLFRRGTRSAGRTPAARTPRRSFTPRLEALEDRLTPSTLTVANLADTGVAGDGSLRGEIAAAAPGDTLVFAPGLQNALNAQGHKATIDLNSTVVLSKNVSIQGPTDANGNPLITLSGQNKVEDLIVNKSVTASLSGLTIANGFLATSGNGGAGIQNLGSLTLSNATVKNNFAQGGDIVLGGGIFNSGTLTVQNSTIAGNTAGAAQVLGPGDGGFITGEGGGIYNVGALTVQNSTLSGNTAGGWGKGGAIMNDRGLWVGIYPKVWRGATATLTGCTITGNTASTGGGIYQTSAGGSLALTNSTIAGNTATLDAGGLYINASAGGTTYLDAFTLAHLTNNSAPSNANSDGPYLTGL